MFVDSVHTWIQSSGLNPQTCGDKQFGNESSEGEKNENLLTKRLHGEVSCLFWIDVSMRQRSHTLPVTGLHKDQGDGIRDGHIDAYLLSEGPQIIVARVDRHVGQLRQLSNTLLEASIFSL